MESLPTSVKRLTVAPSACFHAAMSLVVLYEDNHLLVVDKPAGLLTQAAQAGDDTLVERARAYLKARYDKPGNVYVGLVHRLDRATSGVVVLAKTSKAAARLSEQFARKRSKAGPTTDDDGVDKRYLAVVHGVVRAAGRCDDLMIEVGDGAAIARAGDTKGAKRAVLGYEPIAVSARASLVEVRLETGRKHQIRVQLAAAGHPLVGDRRYGRPDQASRLGLHAWRIALTHPTRRVADGGPLAELAFEAPIPDDFRRLCDALALGPLPLGDESSDKKS